MGIKCPVCNKHGAYKSAITANGLPPVKADDIIGYVLDCGHEIVTADYQEYRDELTKIERAEDAEIRKVREDFKKQKSALWQAKVQKKGEDN